MILTRSAVILCALGATGFAAGVVFATEGTSVPFAQSAPVALAAAACPERPQATGEVFIKGGAFTMGSDSDRPEERMAHDVLVSDFFIDRTEVTNAEFAAFVKETGYITIAERGIGAAGRGKLPDALLQPGGMVFAPPTEPVGDFTDVSRWWRWAKGASWRHPEGPGSTIEDRDHHPVVQVSIEDAYAYAKWAGRALPTEAQWEYAARGGLKDKRYTWGNTYDEADADKANTWQGAFPTNDEQIDGAHGTAAVGCYEANGYGLYDMAGNVWEYAQNWWVPGHPAVAATDPLGPTVREALTHGTALGPQVTVKGGSWLCAPVYCARFRPSARQPQELALGSNHIGFRTVRLPGSRVRTTDVP
ncbi:formylglycine-generating enzyme family protein [Acuticoccus sp. MNP-M23]|uniref:formylglycine-generating enzyme family protein n=1 Tax=Acuticoccus sp. MNP-M23 TaxID=3072793 RepID=UPI0028159071|nr:formylglycine-generating enzyme family protein [Acuticoccus sp. MNP-M23]WMS44556.1 formylglycine-generating enzyme family protein [Acuticoccus sp. MNP-M23]